MVRSKTRDTLAFCLGILLIGVLMQLAGWLKGDDLIFPGVDEILRAFGRLITTGRTYRLIWTTMQHLLASMALATLIGVGVGLLQGMSGFARRLLTPLMIMLRSLPMVVLIVIVMVIFPENKYRNVPVIASTLILTPIISEATCEGCLRIDRELIDVYRMNSGFNLRVLLNVYLPLMAGYLKQAYINAVGMGIKLAVSTEYLVQTDNSLGKTVTTSISASAFDEIYAYALIMILLVLLVSEAPIWIGKLTGHIKAQRLTKA